jgi:hypothetical protein
LPARREQGFPQKCWDFRQAGKSVLGSSKENLRPGKQNLRPDKENLRPGKNQRETCWELLGRSKPNHGLFRDNLRLPSHPKNARILCVHVLAEAGLRHRA